MAVRRLTKEDGSPVVARDVKLFEDIERPDSTDSRCLDVNTSTEFDTLTVQAPEILEHV